MAANLCEETMHLRLDLLKVCGLSALLDQEGLVLLINGCDRKIIIKYGTKSMWFSVLHRVLTSSQMQSLTLGGGII